MILASDPLLISVDPIFISIDAVVFSTKRNIDIDNYLPKQISANNFHDIVNLKVINNLIDKSFCPNGLVLLEQMEYYFNHSNDRTTSVLEPWIKINLLQGHIFSQQLKRALRNTYRFEQYWNTEWVWENNKDYYSFTNYESYCIFYEALLPSVNDQDVHLLRECSAYIKAGICDKEFARNVVKNLHETLKKPELTYHKSKYKIVLNQGHGIVTTWEQLVRYGHRFSSQRLLNIWEEIQKNLLVVTYTDHWQEMVIHKPLKKGVLIQRGCNNVILQSDIVYYLIEKAKSFKIKPLNFFKKEKVVGVKDEFNMNINFSDDVPY